MKAKITLVGILAFTLMTNAVFAAHTNKTLVSWISLKDKNVRAGSVLTIQNGDQFDGIIFAERAAARWMAGSDTFSRTEKDQDRNPVEIADGTTLVQMAIVYRDNQITIYRDGELFVSYSANNIDLLSSKDNVAVFGLRHLGGDGSIVGSIEDARIYGQALTVDEIKALKPNEPSAIQPYAWWDFEGKEIVDRAERYAYSKLEGGAKLDGGKLLLGRGAVLVAARTREGATVYRRSGAATFVGPYVPDTPAWPNNPPDNWPIYHLAHPTSSGPAPFDPNPALFYKGRYHLHYIYRNTAGIAFAHVSSKDMVRWKWHPTVLAPPTTGHGMFSGTGFFTRDGQPAIVYCGWGSGRNWIQYALDDDLNKWSKPQVMLPTDANGKLMVNVPYFDPDIWRNGGTFYGINGVSSSKPPQIMKSNDLKEWTFIGDLLHPDFDEDKLGVKKSEDISCPNMFKLGDKWVLVCISHKLGCRYFIGDFNNEQFLPEHHALLGGNSSRYFAPESLLTPDGRRVNWTWFHTGHMKGLQSLPTELELPSDGVLRMRPIRELESLRYDEQRHENVTVQKESPVLLETIVGENLELKVVINEPGDHSFGVDVLCDERGHEGLRIRLDRKNSMLEVGGERAPFELDENEALTLRIFVDTTFVEVFANERQLIMTEKHRPAGTERREGVALFSEIQGTTFDHITAWKMRSAYNAKSN